MSNSGRNIVFGMIILAVVTAVAVIIRERNKEAMFAMYADVHNLATAQIAYFGEHEAYSQAFPPGYAPTHGASVTITYASDTSWSARATHPSTSSVCVYEYVQPGHATPAQIDEARLDSWKGYDCR